MLDLAAQSLDVNIDQPGVTGVPVAPHLLEEHLAGEHLPGLAGQGDEQVELERGDREPLVATGHRVAGDVDGEVADGEALGLGLVVAPQAGPHPGDELLGLEGLDDVVVGTGFQAHDDVDGVGAGGQHDDRHARLAPDLAAHL